MAAPRRPKVDTSPEEWPNKQDVPDGVVPVAEVSQDPDLFKDSGDSFLELEMKD